MTCARRSLRETRCRACAPCWCKSNKTLAEDGDKAHRQPQFTPIRFVNTTRHLLASFFQRTPVFNVHFPPPPHVYDFVHLVEITTLVRAHTNAARQRDTIESHLCGNKDILRTRRVMGGGRGDTPHACVREATQTAAPSRGPQQVAVVSVSPPVRVRAVGGLFNVMKRCTAPVYWLGQLRRWESSCTIWRVRTHTHTYTRSYLRPPVNVVESSDGR